MNGGNCAVWTIACQTSRAPLSKLSRSGGPFIAHVNPVFDAEGYAPRSLAPEVPAMGVRDAEDLFTMLGFARFATGAASLADLEAYLEGRARRMIDGGRVS